MAIVGSLVTHGNKTANASSYTFRVPVAPGANNLVLACVAGHSSTNTAQPTIAGAMSAWTLVDKVKPYDGLLKHGYLFWGMQPSPVSSVITVTWPGGQSAMHLAIAQFSGVSQQGPVSSASSVGNVSQLAMLLGAPAAGNAVFGFADWKLSSAVTASSNFVLLQSNGQTSPVMNMGSEWTTNNSSRVSLFAASVTSGGGIAVQIARAPTFTKKRLKDATVAMSAFTTGMSSADQAVCATAFSVLSTTASVIDPVLDTSTNTASDMTAIWQQAVALSPVEIRHWQAAGSGLTSAFYDEVLDKVGDAWLRFYSGGT